MAFGPPSPCPYMVRDRIKNLGGSEQFAEEVFNALIERLRFQLEAINLREVINVWRPHVPKGVITGKPPMVTRRAPPESDG